MVKMSGEITQMTAECRCDCTIMTIFQQSSCDRFIWLSLTFLSIDFSNSTLSTTKHALLPICWMLYHSKYKYLLHPEDITVHKMLQV